MTGDTFRIDPLTVPEDETPEETFRRLAPLAEAELEAAKQRAEMAGIPLLATATDGSLGTRRVWPSSDLDVMLVPAKTPPQTIEWGIRAGLVVHRHLNSWEALIALRDGYPQSFIDTAAGDWVRDPTWMLDGLATFAPAYDPDGRLTEMRDFVLQGRFAPEVVVPRRPLLLRRAEALAQDAVARFEAGEERDGVVRLEWAMEALSLIWLEADARIISHKELDPELAAACAAQGCPEAHGLFRVLAGLETLPDASEVKAAARRMLEVFSRWLEGPLDASPNNPQALQDFLPRLVYVRHRLWAASLAPSRDCWLLLAAERTFLQAVVGEVAALMEKSAGAAFREAVEMFAGVLSPASPSSVRLAALDSLIRRTSDLFEGGAGE